MVRLFAALLLVLPAACAPGAPPPPQLAPVSAPVAAGIVSAADPRAAEAGREILRAGGSAVDAAMAMMLALTVVEPQSSGIGGGGYLLHHDGESGALATIDGRETAPASVTPDLFLGPDGKPMPFVEAWLGGRSVGVPGNVRLLERAHRLWGKLPWPRLFAPAIRLAEDGFTVTPRLAKALAGLRTHQAGFPGIQALYWRDGAPVTAGSQLRNPELAALLRDLAANGADAFYRGQTAAAISAAVAGAPRHPATLTAADLAGYEAKDRIPLCGRYRSYRVCSMGPSSSGAVTVLSVLGMLERFDLRALGPKSPVSWHLIGEAMRLAYADRAKYLGDPDFVALPLPGLVDRDYLARRSALISPERALGSYPAGDPPGAAPRTAAPAAEAAGTTHFIAIDRAGDIASMTSTVESAFGSQLVARGMILNNELTDFSFAPARDGAPVANRPEPGKRPLSAMSPTIVYDAADRPVFVVGAAGGRTIIMQVAKAIIAHVDWQLPADQAIGLPLLFFNDRGLAIEGGTSLEAMKLPLERLGHVVTIGSFSLKANAAEWVDGRWRGAADPRSEGVALTE